VTGRFRWVLAMAWRDTRSSRRHLVLYAVSIVLGIAALVSIASFGENLKQAIGEQSKALLGADLVLSSSDPFSDEAEELFTEMGGDRAREIGFPSMILFEDSGRSRLVSVRAIESGFPFYGDLETDPVDAGRRFRSGHRLVADESLLMQFDAHRDDRVRLGSGQFTVAGTLRKVPGESPGAGMVAPRVYIPFDTLPSTDLVRKGSRVTYRIYFRFPQGVDIEKRLEPLRARFSELNLSSRTVSSRQRSLGRAYRNLNRFLELVGIVALLLGSVGVASGIHVFVREKLSSVAVLRCLGATARSTVSIYLIQATMIGLLGAALGAGLAGAVLQMLPLVLGDLLVVEIENDLSWRAVLEGLSVGVGMTVLFALFPLLEVRRVSPLSAIRSTVEAHPPIWRDWLRLFTALVLLGGICGFILLQVDSRRYAAAFALGILGSFGLLTLTGWGLMRAARLLVPRKAPYVIRQGLANLHRPNNRTLLVVLALGLGTFLVSALNLVQGMLIHQVEVTAAEDDSNMILFDIQPDQRDGVADLMHDHGLPLVAEAPVVTMRLASINGRANREIRDDKDRKISRWVLNREYRSTFRRSLTGTETMHSGEWFAEWTSNSDPVPISLEIGIAEEMRAGLGDRLEFDVQGVPVSCVVANLREVDWRRVRPNFFVVFPVGPIDAAPWFAIMSTRIPDSAASAAFQRDLLERFPNVSAIDLRLILETVNSVLDKVSFVFRFLALFTVVTGLIVLTGSVLAGRYQRLRENVLLRTLGASRRQVGWIEVSEYFLLGSIAAGAGAILAWFASWAIGHFVFELRGLPAILPLVVACLVVPAMTVAVGWATGLRFLNHPPLAVLREE